MTTKKNRNRNPFTLQIPGFVGAFRRPFSVVRISLFAARFAARFVARFVVVSAMFSGILSAMYPAFFQAALPVFANTRSGYEPQSLHVQIYQGNILFSDATIHNLSLRHPVLILDGDYYFPLSPAFSAAVGLQVTQYHSTSSEIGALLRTRGGGAVVERTNEFAPMHDSAIGQTVDIEQISLFAAPIFFDRTLLSTTKPVYELDGVIYLCFDDIRGFDITSTRLLRRGLLEETHSLPPRYSVFDRLNPADFVRDQGSTLNCWAYAANSMMELKIALEEGKILNFSEDHLVSNCPVPSDPRSGGNWRGSAAYLTRGIGPVSEENAGSDQIRYLVTAYDEVKGIERIKQAIYENGSALTAIYYGSDRHRYYNKDTFAYYHTDPRQGATHELLIVGWDNDYPKENFLTEPPMDGAFIAMNSFGSLFGNGGFFYISYADSFMQKSAQSVRAYKAIPTKPGEEPVVLSRGDTGVTHYETLHGHGSAVYGIVKMNREGTEEPARRLRSIGVFSSAEAVVTIYYAKEFPQSLDELTLLGETYFSEAGFRAVDTLLPVTIQDESYFVLKYASKTRFVLPVEAPYPGIDYEIAGEPNTSFIAYEERRMLHPTPLEVYKPNGSIVIRLYLE